MQMAAKFHPGSPSLVSRRLRGWGGGAAEAEEVGEPVAEVAGM